MADKNDHRLKRIPQDEQDDEIVTKFVEINSTGNYKEPGFIQKNTGKATSIVYKQEICGCHSVDCSSCGCHDVCTCDQVCTCDSHTSSESVCTCNTVTDCTCNAVCTCDVHSSCTCNNHSTHYWYPN